MDELTRERYPYEWWQLAAELRGGDVWIRPVSAWEAAEIERAARLRAWRLRREAYWFGKAA